MPFLGKQPAEAALVTGDLGDDIVTEAKVANDAIGLTELKAGTDGEIISWDASGDPVAIGVGTSGHFLKSQGAGSQPVFAAAGGAWNVIGTSVASNSASLTITGLDSTYDTYAIGLSDLIPATDGVVPWMRVGDSSGIDSGSTDYEHFTNALYGGNAAPTNTTSGGDTKIILWSTADGDTVGSASGEGFGGGILYLHQPGDSSQWSQITGTTCGIGAGSGQSVIGNAVMGTRRAVITLDRVQFLFSSGNITSGRMTIWGIAHA